MTVRSKPTGWSSQCNDIDASKRALEAAIPKLSQLVDEMQPNLIKRGGGIRGMEVRSTCDCLPMRP